MQHHIDIPGTTLFDGVQARKGYALNKMCFSFNEAANRQAFVADEEAYMRAYGLNETQAAAIRARNVLQLIAAGGNVYYLAKLFSTDGLSFAEAVSSMTEYSFAEYREMMNKGGRSPIGNRSIKGGY